MRPGADGNRPVTKVCNLDKVRQQALKTLNAKSSLDGAALKRHLRHCDFYKHVEASVGPGTALRNVWIGRAERTGCRQGWLETYARDIRSVQAGHPEV